MKMGYCAKVRIYSHIYCVIVVVLFISKHVCDVHGASKGSSWPSMKTYDIWGMPQNKAIQSSGNGGSNTMTASNDLEIQDYRHKTSFRNEKGMEHTRICVNSICYVCYNIYSSV